MALYWTFTISIKKVFLVEVACKMLPLKLDKWFSYDGRLITTNEEFFVGTNHSMSYVISNAEMFHLREQTCDIFTQMYFGARVLHIDVCLAFVLSNTIDHNFMLIENNIEDQTRGHSSQDRLAKLYYAKVMTNGIKTDLNFVNTITAIQYFAETLDIEHVVVIIKHLKIDGIKDNGVDYDLSIDKWLANINKTNSRIHIIKSEQLIFDTINNNLENRSDRKLEIGTKFKNSLFNEPAFRKKLEECVSFDEFVIMMRKIIPMVTSQQKSSSQDDSTKISENVSYLVWMTRGDPFSGTPRRELVHSSVRFWAKKIQRKQEDSTKHISILSPDDERKILQDFFEVPKQHKIFEDKRILWLNNYHPF